MADIYLWIFVGGHSLVLGQRPKKKVSEDGVQDQQKKKEKKEKKKQITGEEIGKCDTLR